MVLIAVAIFAWRRSAAPVEIHSLAILGLENRSGDASQDYFADGLTNALAAGLGRLNGLRVIPPSASLTYRGTKKPLRRNRKRTKRRRAAGRTVFASRPIACEIRTRLVNARGGRDLWSHTYDSAASGPAGLAKPDRARHRRPGACLRARSRADDRHSQTRPARLRSLSARKLPPRGASPLKIRTRPSRLFEQAVAIAPDFAPLQANLAGAYAQKSFFFAPDDQQLEGRAFAAIEKAFALDPDSAEAHLARGELLWRPSHGFPHRAALAEFRLAAAAQPNLEDAFWEIAADPDSRRACGRSAGGIAQNASHQSRAKRGGPCASPKSICFKASLSCPSINETGQRADWVIPIMEFDYIWSLIDLGRFEEAARSLRTGFDDSSPGATGLKHAVSALLAARQGNRQAAESEIRAALAESHGFGHFHHITFMIACAYSVLGDVAQAQEWMEKTAADGFPCFTLFEVEPSLERWRATPKGHEFLVNLRHEWEATP